MRIRDAALLALAATMTAQLALAGEVRFANKPVARKANGKMVIAFAVSAATDVEVAILDAKGKVVRHLAAGVLGGKTPPPPPLKPGLSQKLEWDGNDDYGQKVSGGPFSVRVRAGMGARLEKIVGGDPYAFYSRQSGQGDHFQWKMAGIESKSDGKVYVMGNTTFYGSQVIRQYDGAGNYIKTVFPPPADKSLDEVRGWGVNVRPDGTFTLKNNAGWMGTGLGTTGISASRYGKIVASFVASPDTDSLTLRVGSKFFQARTDGTLKACQPQPLFGSTPLPAGSNLRGPCYTALAPDGKHLYVSGLHSCKRKPRSNRALSVHTTGFWRDGQVWKLDLATRKMSVFYALDEKKVISDMKTRSSGPIGDKNYIAPFAALHGVAVDAEGRVFVCDRQNKRIVVLDKNGKLIREIPNVAYPDAIGVSPKSKALYVTTRFARGYGGGKLALLKFNDWSKDSAPAVTLPLAGNIGRFPPESMLTVVEKEGQVMVWVVYTTLPARVYKDTAAGLELVKDFYQAGPQRALDLQHMQVDRKTGHVYIDDAAGWCFRITDWKDPRFRVCIDAATKKRIGGTSIAIDHRNRYLYAQRSHNRTVRRYRLDGDLIKPAPAGSSGSQVTHGIMFGWGFNGLRPKGMAVCPDGALVTLGVVLVPGKRTKPSYAGHITYWKRDETKAPWQSLYLGRQSSAGIRFDPRGNMYISAGTRKPKGLPKAYARERHYYAQISKFAPTGSMKNGGLYPKAPEKAARIYEVRMSPIGGGYKTPRFGVDEYGRVYYPNGIESRVGAIDNAGNRILSFGTYANRDSAGGLKGDLVPTKDVPMAWPMSVDATDEYIYVTDIINTRLLRLKKTFAAEKTCAVK
jgi:NHL repeat